MRSAREKLLTAPQRRQAIRLSLANAFLWAVGNGMTSTTLMIVLAMQYGAAGFAVGLLRAAPQLVGGLRAGAAGLIRVTGSRRRFCVLCYLASGLLLLSLPVASAPGVFPSPQYSLAALVILWSAYHLLEYFGTVSLWSWLGDVFPARIRGRIIGYRERWLLVGRIGGMLAVGVFSLGWRATYPPSQRWQGYAIPAAIGALMMIAAVWPLVRMTDVPLALAAKPARAPWGKLLAPLRDVPFLRLVLLGCFLSAVNGLTQAAQGLYPFRVLDMFLFAVLAMQSGMRLGQSVVAPLMGRLADRAGNKSVLAGSLVLVATGPLFFLLATPQQPWWFAGAWIVWIAWAGVNVAMPNLMLKLSPGGSSPSHIAMYFAVTGVIYGISTIAGGILLDQLNQYQWHFAGLDAYEVLFAWATAARMLSVVVLIVVVKESS